MTRREMTAEEFDEYFDNGGDITEFIDPAKVSFPNRDGGTRRVNFNMPAWLVDAIDSEAKHLGIPRQSVAIVWLSDRAKQERLAV